MPLGTVMGIYWSAWNWSESRGRHKLGTPPPGKEYDKSKNVVLEYEGWRKVDKNFMVHQEEKEDMVRV